MPPYASTRSYSSTPRTSSSSTGSTSTIEAKKPKFQITLYSATGKKINTWSGTAVRLEDGVCKFYNDETGTLVQITGTIMVE